MGRLEDTGLSGALAALSCTPASPAQAGVGQQMEPKPSLAPGTEDSAFSCSCRSASTPRAKPKQATKQGLGMGGCSRGVSRGRAFTCEQGEVGG